MAEIVPKEFRLLERGNPHPAIHYLFLGRRQRSRHVDAKETSFLLCIPRARTHSVQVKTGDSRKPSAHSLCVHPRRQMSLISVRFHLLYRLNLWSYDIIQECLGCPNVVSRGNSSLSVFLLTRSEHLLCCCKNIAQVWILDSGVCTQNRATNKSPILWF